MKIHYLSAHSILEYDEVKLLTELGHEVFSNGAYLDPRGHFSLPRPGIPDAKYYEDYAAIARNSSRTNLPTELIEPFDVFIVMHLPELLSSNWDKIKHKRVVWRGIGQSVPWIETVLSKMKAEGLKLVRYSPKEANIPNYAGMDALIRFYKDPEEFNNWRGTDPAILNATQSLKGRRNFCGYDLFMEATEGLEKVVLGSGNEDLGAISAGEVDYERYKDRLRDHRVFFYTGTWPASYTLAFIEAWMTGIPVVSIGRNRWLEPHSEHVDTFEVHELIDNVVNGYVSDVPRILKNRLSALQNDHEVAKKIGEAGRAKAIEVFGKEKIKEQWKIFLESL